MPRRMYKVIAVRAEACFSCLVMRRFRGSLEGSRGEFSLDGRPNKKTQDTINGRLIGLLREAFLGS